MAGRHCIKEKLMLKVVDFNFKIKELEDFTKDEIIDKTSLRAMFLLNS